MSKRCRLTADFKARVALEALRGDRTIQEIGSRHKVHPDQVGTWKKQALEGLGSIFESGSGKSDDRSSEFRDLHAKIGELAVQNDFLSRALRLSFGCDRSIMIPSILPAQSLSAQCRILQLNRASLYYRPKGESAETLALMRRIDELFMAYPFFGSCQVVRHLVREGTHVGRLMRKMGLQAINQAHPEHKIYPYLLKDLVITAANHVWCADISYIPIQRGFLYLVAVMGWAIRKVLAWKLSNTMDARLCVEALDDAMQRYGSPAIFNTDQGSQFTSAEFTDRLRAAEIKISIDGRGRCLDNIFIERLWRSLKYESVYLVEMTDGFHAERVIAEWIAFYNGIRPHSSLGGRTPDEAYGVNQPGDMMDKAATLPTSSQALQQRSSVVSNSGMAA